MKLPLVFIILSIMLTTNSCANIKKNKNSLNNPNNQEKQDLKKLSSGNNTDSDVSSIRIQALRDTALSVGARGGLSWRAEEINKVLSKYEKSLTRVFNFHGMLLDDNVLPPVLIEGRNTLSLTGTDVIRIAEVNYHILHQAKFTTNPPTWQDYLWLSYGQPEMPDKTLLPKNKNERPIWEKYIEEGWEAGIKQAEIIFKENLHRLKRDYLGMIRYRKLLAQNMVSSPYVASLDLGITGDGTNLTVNDRVLRITAFPSLQTDGAQWTTEIRQHEQ